VALSPKTARTLNKKKKKTSCAELQQYRQNPYHPIHPFNFLIQCTYNKNVNELQRYRTRRHVALCFWKSDKTSCE